MSAESWRQRSAMTAGNRGAVFQYSPQDLVQSSIQGAGGRNNNVQILDMPYFLGRGQTAAFTGRSYERERIDVSCLGTEVGEEDTGSFVIFWSWEPKSQDKESFRCLMRIM